MEGIEFCGNLEGEYIDQYELLHQIGKGGNAIVRLAKAPDGSEVAMKIPFQYTKALDNEIEIHNQLNSTNVIKLISHGFTGIYKNY